MPIRSSGTPIHPMGRCSRHCPLSDFRCSVARAAIRNVSAHGFWYNSSAFSGPSSVQPVARPDSVSTVPQLPNAQPQPFLRSIPRTAQDILARAAISPTYSGEQWQLDDRWNSHTRVCVAAMGNRNYQDGRTGHSSRPTTGERCRSASRQESTGPSVHLAWSSLLR